MCFEGKRQVQLGEMESNEALVSDDGAFDEMQEQQEEGQHQQSIMHSTTYGQRNCRGRQHHCHCSQ